MGNSKVGNLSLLRTATVVSISLLLIACKEEGVSNEPASSSVTKPEPARDFIELNDGARFSGEIINDKKQGFGVYIWVNGDRYEGGWDNDTMSGTGLFIDNAGRSYEGQWVSGQYSGEGVYKLFLNEEYRSFIMVLQ